DRKKEDFRLRLLATFRVEAAEHLRVLSTGLLELEKASAAENHPQTLETIFREAHSLKGAARAVNAGPIEAICQSLENVFSSWQRKETVPTSNLFDLLHRATDSLESILASLGTEAETRAPGDGQPGPAALIASLEQAARPRSAPTPRPER